MTIAAFERASSYLGYAYFKEEHQDILTWQIFLRDASIPLEKIGCRPWERCTRELSQIPPVLIDDDHQDGDDNHQDEDGGGGGNSGFLTYD